MKAATAEKLQQEPPLVTDLGPRCEAVSAINGKPCGRLLALKLTRPWAIDCTRCGCRNEKS